jgi:succinate dehydrogenase / fumarate reductase, iron-sulfur subunit
MATTYENVKLEVSIKRFNPEKDSAAHTETYRVDAFPTERVLDVLNKVKWDQDGTLTYRKSCAHGVCGSDAMMINGENKLACVTLVKDVVKGASGKIVIEPLPGASVVKDLVVDMNRFWKNYETIMPYLCNDDPAPEIERYMSSKDQEIIEESTRCILCGACSFSCPSTWSDEEYLGPAALLKAYRFIFDSRDHAADERLNVIDNNKGLWKCYTIFNCVQACPKEIDITKHISALKRKTVSEKY